MTMSLTECRKSHASFFIVTNGRMVDGLHGHSRRFNARKNEALCTETQLMETDQLHLSKIGRNLAEWVCQHKATILLRDQSSRSDQMKWEEIAAASADITCLCCIDRMSHMTGTIKAILNEHMMSIADTKSVNTSLMSSHNLDNSVSTTVVCAV